MGGGVGVPRCLVLGPRPRRGPKFLGSRPLSPRPLGSGARARHTVVTFETSKNKN